MAYGALYEKQIVGSTIVQNLGWVLGAFLFPCQFHRDPTVAPSKDGRGFGFVHTIGNANGLVLP